MAGEILTNAKPPFKKDVVYIHASAEGWQNKQLVRDEFVNAYYPVEIDGQSWSAILFGIPDSLDENDFLFFPQVDSCGQHRSINP